jgi:hypothetical protein
VATPDDFLNLAIKLLDSAGCDAEYRVVIDRAYYGSFHWASEFEERLPERSQITIKDVGSHEALIRRLECPHPKLDYGLQIISKDIGAQLRMLKPERELASYNLKETVRIDQAEGAVLKARDIRSECSNGLAKISKNK